MSILIDIVSIWDFRPQGFQPLHIFKEIILYPKIQASRGQVTDSIYDSIEYYDTCCGLIW